MLNISLLHSNRDLEFTDGASGIVDETPGDHRANKGVGDMILIKEVCMTVMEAMRPKEKPSHNCFAVIPLFVPQLSAAFLGCALGNDREGVGGKAVAAEKSSHRGKSMSRG